MKTTFILSGLLLSVSLFSQTSNRLKELETKISKSHYFKLFPDTQIKFIAEKYHCLEKEYQIKPEQEKEFLNKKDFKKRFPEYQIQFDRSIETASTLQESLKIEHYNHETKESEIFPKCLKLN